MSGTLSVVCPHPAVNAELEHVAAPPPTYPPTNLIWPSMFTTVILKNCKPW